MEKQSRHGNAQYLKQQHKLPWKIRRAILRRKEAIPASTNCGISTMELAGRLWQILFRLARRSSRAKAAAPPGRTKLCQNCAKIFFLGDAGVEKPSPEGQTQPFPHRNRGAALPSLRKTAR